jgi:serine/threonine-protein kinase
VLHQIGVGALGPVFRTYEPTRDRLVAVKVFRLDITPEQARALADELARAADAGLFHPSVVEPIAAGVEGTVAYRADEYVAAESLDVAMRHYAPAPVDKILPFITQLAGAIDFARAAGVGHGALHPRDIFVTPDEARATGFGVVDALERVGLRAPVRRPYSPPERVAGAPWSTPADVFSLAVIAFELLTARRPAGTGEEIGPLTGAPISAHGEEIRAVLARAMNDDPDRRYPTALAFASALEAAARGEGDAPVVSIPPPGVPVAAASVSASGVASPEAVEPEPAGDPDDIAAEREEDEAHWAMSREEAAANLTPDPELEGPRPAAGMPTGDGVAEVVDRQAAVNPELAVDPRPAIDTPVDDFRLRMVEPLSAVPEPVLPPREDPAGPAVRPAPVLKPFDSRPAPRPRKPPTVFDTHDALLDADAGGLDARQPPDRAPITMLPLAMTLILGLLLGFAAGYTVGGGQRSSDGAIARGDVASQTGSPSAEPGPAGTTSPPTREFSEQAVAPAQPAPTSPAPPDVPADSASAAASGSGSGAPATPARRTGRMVVRSTPSGAAVTVNGDWRGRTPLPLEDLAFGKYAVRIVLPGHAVVREDVSLSAAEPSRVLSVRLNKLAAAAPPARTAPASRDTQPQSFTGVVFVDSRPRGATVSIDGKEYGKTPIRIPDIPIGSHVVRLELADHRFWTTSIRVTAGKDTPVTGSLEPIR